MFTEQTALIALDKSGGHGLDFFRVASVALLGDRLLRLVRIFENNKRVASFWYLYRSNPKNVEQAVVAANATIDQFLDFSRRLKPIRDQTFIHIDKAVFDAEEIYRQAGITKNDVNDTIRSLWSTMQALYQDTFGQAFQYTSYSGEDIAALNAELERRRKQQNP